jgi:hypothetical protein
MAVRRRSNSFEQVDVFEHFEMLYAGSSIELTVDGKSRFVIALLIEAWKRRSPIRPPIRPRSGSGKHRNKIV